MHLSNSEIQTLIDDNIENMVLDTELACQEPINGEYRGEEQYEESNYIGQILDSVGWTMSWSRILGEHTQDENLVLPLVILGNKHEANIAKYQSLYNFAANFGNLYLCGLSKIRAGGSVHMHADVRCSENESLTTNTATWNGTTEGGVPLTDTFPLTIMNVPLIIPDGGDCHIKTYDHNVELIEDHSHSVGTFFAFDPRLLHMATNESDGYRVVMVVYYDSR